MKRILKNMFGFTVIEFLVCVLVVTAIAVVALTNIRTLRAENRDSNSKSDINTLVFQLESFYEKNNYYPEVISTQTLSGSDSEMFIDSRSRQVNEEGSVYRYNAGGCNDSKCRTYELTATLEREAPFIKQSLNN